MFATAALLYKVISIHFWLSSNTNQPSPESQSQGKQFYTAENEAKTCFSFRFVLLIYFASLQVDLPSSFK